MFKKGLILNFLIGGFFYIFFVSMFLNVYGGLSVKANELTDVIENGYLPLYEEIEQDNVEILSDSVRYISGVNDEMEDQENFSDDYQDNQDSNVMEEDITNEDKYKIMIIFCFGLLSGVIVGHFLTGFIK